MDEAMFLGNLSIRRRVNLCFTKNTKVLHASFDKGRDVVVSKVIGPTREGVFGVPNAIAKDGSVDVV